MSSPKSSTKKKLLRTTNPRKSSKYEKKNYNDKNMKEHLIFDWKTQVVTLSSFPPFALLRYPANRATEKDKGYL